MALMDPPDYTTTRPQLVLSDLLRIWPVACSIVEGLPTGSLFSLARTSSSIRAILHGFDDDPIVPIYEDQPDTLPPNPHQIGLHSTSYWENLKHHTIFKCSSPKHTKGTKAKSCQYCSTPICEGCIVKHSLNKDEHTFKNRCRYLCQHCWATDNPQRECRYMAPETVPGTRGPHRSLAEKQQFCICESRDGWLCIACKESQNQQARRTGSKICFGQNCNAPIDVDPDPDNGNNQDKDRRRICLWCDMPVLRGRANMQARVAFDAKIAEARELVMSSRLSDTAEDRVSRRRRMLKSRRQHFGDIAIKGDPPGKADEMVFVRNLDVFNYRRLCKGVGPTGDQIYGSKHGTWRYGMDFLRLFRRPCGKRQSSRGRDLAEMTRVLYNGTAGEGEREGGYSNQGVFSMRAAGKRAAETRPSGQRANSPTERRRLRARSYAKTEAKTEAILERAFDPIEEGETDLKAQTKAEAMLKEWQIPYWYDRLYYSDRDTSRRSLMERMDAYQEKHRAATESGQLRDMDRAELHAELARITDENLENHRRFEEDPRAARILRRSRRGQGEAGSSRGMGQVEEESGSSSDQDHSYHGYGQTLGTGTGPVSNGEGSSAQAATAPLPPPADLPPDYGADTLILESGAPI